MQTIEPRLEIEFNGSPEERELAARVFAIMRTAGRFFALTAPIRMPLQALAEHLARLDQQRDAEGWAAALKLAVEANDAVFSLEERDGVLYVATTREGRPPRPVEEVDAAHMLPRRFQEPPTVAPPVARRRPVAVARPAADEELAAEAVASAAPEPAEAAAAPVEIIPAPSEIQVVDLSQIGDDVLQALVAAELATMPEVAGFADRWMLDEDVPRLSRGNLRRLREYILERGQPLPDTELVEVVLGVRRSAPDYEVQRFALNVRLSQEEDFEFVGVPGNYLWSTKGLPAIGTTKRRAADIGQDYRFLIEEALAAIPLSEQVADHVLTFYEHYLGVLPYNAILASVLPPQVLADQRVAVLTFESPQTYETFLVELRYPSGNRGGYLAGFDAFFRDSLVPGALITIERTDTPGHYTIDYLRVSGQERRLLDLDEKNRRYIFRPTTYYCAVQENMLLTENRFPRFAGQEPLDDRTRRYPDLVLAATFERVGEQIGTSDAPRYMALLDDLVAAANVERPMTPELIRQIAESPDYPQFSIDPDAEDVLYYAPSP
ncbi:hypothetical protein NET02_12750 [Thermomicrobiaceae bacterium CFH 74404]|uniref:Uncharacterized protein n=1 Tax=Thermalbibacter longus TaxID=2951981 RepID=A0AA42BAR6_9BACT|nr:hypothetical protein [Thermalbibacter longus]MCM8750017.1 hypothetical protein [Thermalbibacter longus]